VKLPFTTDQFLDVFARYNVAVWPAQLFVYLLGVLCIILALRRSTYSSLIISLILSVFWLWMGVVYHFLFFSKINQAAWMFGSLFILQSLIFIYVGVIRHNLSFHFRRDAFGIGGAVLLTYALIIYPTLGYLHGREYPAAPTFGLPCPTTIFTLGFLLWAKAKVRLYVVIVPLFWSVVGFFAAFSLTIMEDYGLLGAGLVASTLFILGSKRARLPYSC